MNWHSTKFVGVGDVVNNNDNNNDKVTNDNNDDAADNVAEKGAPVTSRRWRWKVIIYGVVENKTTPKMRRATPTPMAPVMPKMSPMKPMTSRTPKMTQMSPLTPTPPMQQPISTPFSCRLNLFFCHSSPSLSLSTVLFVINL